MANDSFRNLNKDNVWSNNYINNFQDMIDNHHQSLNSFVRVGTMLETSSRIYGLKVDSLHNEILQLSSGIRRQHITSTTPPYDTSFASTTSDISHNIPAKKRRRSFSKIASKDTINSPLKTDEPPSNLWHHLNTETRSSARNLLQNVLPSDKYALSIQSRKRFLFQDDDAMSTSESESTIFNSSSVDLPHLDWIPSSSDRIRPVLSGFKITNESTVVNIDQQAMEVDDNDNQVDDHSSLDLPFDVDADIIAPIDPIVLTPVVLSNSFTDDDRNALERCSVLQRKTPATDDLRPLSTNPLEYSYRRLSEGQLPADASHWKLPSIVHQNNSQGTRNRRRRTRRTVSKPVKCRETIVDTIETKFISVDDPQSNGIKKSNHTKWLPDKLKMALKMRPATALSFFPLMIGSTENRIPTEPDEANINLTTNDTSERDSNSDGIDVFLNESPNLNENHDIDEVIDTNVYEDDNVMTMTPMTVPTQPILPLKFVQRTPSNIDVKAVTKRCFEIICDLEKNGSEVTFAQVYHRLQTCNPVISSSFTFFLILELANKNSFILEKISENDFVIKRNRT